MTNNVNTTMELNLDTLALANGGHFKTVDAWRNYWEMKERFVNAIPDGEPGSYTHYYKKAYLSKYGAGESVDEFVRKAWDGGNARNLLAVARDWDSIDLFDGKLHELYRN